VISRPTARFERIFLTPLSFILPVVAVVSFFDKAWFVGGYFVLAWFWNAINGQSLHPDKSVEQLKRGGLTDEPNVRQNEVLLQEEYRRLAKAIFFFSLMIGILATVLMIH
jgi:preprotein translocase subunit SecY